MNASPDAADARIRALGTLRSSPTVDEETAALVETLSSPTVRNSLDRDVRRFRVPRARAAFVGAAIALAGMGVAVPATALTTWLARTGDFGDPTTSTEVDDTEWIDLSAPDASDVVVEAYPEYLTLPNGATKAHAISSVSRSFEKMSDGIAQEGLMTQAYEFFAICAWTDDWREAEKAADSSRADQAGEWLTSPANYPKLVAVDGGGVIDAILRFSEGGREGNFEEVNKLYDQFGCARILDGLKP